MALDRRQKKRACQPANPGNVRAVRKPGLLPRKRAFSRTYLPSRMSPAYGYLESRVQARCMQPGSLATRTRINSANLTVRIARQMRRNFTVRSSHLVAGCESGFRVSNSGIYTLWNSCEKPLGRAGSGALFRGCDGTLSRAWANISPLGSRRAVFGV